MTGRTIVLGMGIATLTLLGCGGDGAQLDPGDDTQAEQTGPDTINAAAPTEQVTDQSDTTQGDSNQQATEGMTADSSSDGSGAAAANPTAPESNAGEPAASGANPSRATPVTLKCERREIKLDPACRPRSKLQALAAADCSGQVIDLEPIKAGGKPFCPGHFFSEEWAAVGGEWLNGGRVPLAPGTRGLKYSCCPNVDEKLSCHVQQREMADCSTLSALDKRVELEHERHRKEMEEKRAHYAERDENYDHPELFRQPELAGRLSGKVQACTLIERDGKVVASLNDGESLHEGQLEVGLHGVLGWFDGERREIPHATIRHGSCCEAKYLACHDRTN
jgi:hypothetical protein